MLCVGLLELARAPFDCLARLADHVADGGRLAVVAPRRSLIGRLYRRMSSLDVQLFDRAALDEVLAARGLRPLGHVLHLFPLDRFVAAWIR